MSLGFAVIFCMSAPTLAWSTGVVLLEVTGSGAPSMLGMLEELMLWMPNAAPAASTRPPTIHTIFDGLRRTRVGATGAAAAVTGAAAGARSASSEATASTSASCSSAQAR